MDWNELKTAAQVLRLGTISAAAEALNVHRATVTRHIDQLEATLGAKLFHRHARGLTPTALGLDLLRISEATDEQFGQFHRRAQGQSQSLDGELIVTAIESLAPRLMPTFNSFREQHPLVNIRFIASETLLKLEYGQAHVAFRVGPRPQDPDNVVRPLTTVQFGMYATSGYVARHDHPRGPGDWDRHSFVGGDSEAPRSPFHIWMLDNIPAERIHFRTNRISVMSDAICSGIGIGFMLLDDVRQRDDLVEILAPRPEWESTVWVVTHVDLHRTAKIKAFLDILRDTTSKATTAPQSAPA